MIVRTPVRRRAFFPVLLAVDESPFLPHRGKVQRGSVGIGDLFVAHGTGLGIGRRVSNESFVGFFLGCHFVIPPMTETTAHGEMRISFKDCCIHD